MHIGICDGRCLWLRGVLSARIFGKYFAESGAVNDKRCDHDWIRTFGRIQFPVGDFSLPCELVFVAVPKSE